MITLSLREIDDLRNRARQYELLNQELIKCCRVSSTTQSNNQIVVELEQLKSFILKNLYADANEENNVIKFI